MAANDFDDNDGPPYGAGEDDRILRQARMRFERAKDWEADARKHFTEDMRFANGDPTNKYQWDEKTLAARAGRPCLTVNKTRTHCLQIVNDARQNKPEIRISPVGDGATYDAAQIFEGICRHIQYISNAAQAYDTATYNQVYGNIGYWRVLTDYAHDNTFEQEIFIRRVPDPMEIYLDPDIQQYDGSDAKWGFVFREMTKEDFRAEYPDHADAASDPIGGGDVPLDRTGWTDDKHVRVAEYYRLNEEPDTLHELATGEVVRKSQTDAKSLELAKAMGMGPVKSRDVAEVKVEWFLIAGHKIIDRKIWPGKYIPIVRVPCEETVIENKLDRISHTRHLRDPQQLYNWYTSSAAEFVALQSKAPFIATAEAIEGNKHDWENANTTTKAVLVYKGIDLNGQPVQRPERAQAPVMANAYMDGLKIAQAEMMMASGQYQAIMGEPSNETSGKAINARQRQGDNATYHIIDHLSGAIRFTGRILLDLIPKVYDTKRVMMIMGEDGGQSTIHIDPGAPVAHATLANPNAPAQAVNPQGQPDPEQAQIDAVRTIFNPRVGRYDVIADVGPSYATKRAEAFNAFSQIMAQNAQAFAVVGDFWAQNADFPGADELAARLKQGLPPQYSGGPSPEVMKAQQALQQTQANAHQLLGKADAEVASLKAEIVRLQEQAKERAGELSIRDYESETKRLATVGAIDPEALKLLIREMVSQMIGMPALPAMAAHSAAERAMIPDNTAAAGQSLQPADGPTSSLTVGPTNETAA